MLEGVPYDSVAFALEPGDRLILYSDGITDCRNPAGASFDLARLERLASDFQESPLGTLAARLDATLRDWRGTGKIEDDISLLMIERR